MIWQHEWTLCWLALLLIRVFENGTGDTRHSIRHELDRLRASPRPPTTARSPNAPFTAAQQTTLGALKLPEPPRSLDFTVPAGD